MDVKAKDAGGLSGQLSEVHIMAWGHKIASHADGERNPKIR